MWRRIRRRSHHICGKSMICIHVLETWHYMMDGPVIRGINMFYNSSCSRWEHPPDRSRQHATTADVRPDTGVLPVDRTPATRDRHLHGRVGMVATGPDQRTQGIRHPADQSHPIPSHQSHRSSHQGWCSVQTLPSTVVLGKKNSYKFVEKNSLVMKYDQFYFFYRFVEKNSLDMTYDQFKNYGCI